jgi:signal transduction histidine kinase
LLHSRILLVQQATELQKLNSTQNQILSIISHDLRTPLASLTLLLDNIVAENASQLPTRVLRALDLMEALTKESYEMLDNMLHWTRFQTKQVKPFPVVYDIGKQVSKVMRLYEVTALQKNITITFETYPECLVYADENMIHIVLRNLINNAIKFSPKGSSIDISLETNAEFAKVNISDNGKGLSEEAIHKALSEIEFYSKTGTQGEKGTGLGLKICQHFIKLNSGQFAITSVPEKGTKVSVLLPYGNSFVNFS